MGDGCTEAASLLALLGLPNAYTMESRSFMIMEERISPYYVKKLTSEILHENLTEEARSSAATPEDFKLWQQAQEDDPLLLCF
jgi:hypothetical protein